VDVVAESNEKEFLMDTPLRYAIKFLSKNFFGGQRSKYWWDGRKWLPDPYSEKDRDVPPKDAEFFSDPEEAERRLERLRQRTNHPDHMQVVRVEESDPKDFLLSNAPKFALRLHNPSDSSGYHWWEGRMQQRDSGLVWDIGSGTWSDSVSAANKDSITPSTTLYDNEEDAARVRDAMWGDLDANEQAKISIVPVWPEHLKESKCPFDDIPFPSDAAELRKHRSKRKKRRKTKRPIL